MSEKPADTSSSQRFGRPSEERVVQRFIPLKPPSEPETLRQKKLTDEETARIQSYSEQLKKVRNQIIKEELIAIIKQGNHLSGHSLANLLSKIDKDPILANNAAFKYLKSENIAKKMKTIEDALKVDPKKRFDYETRKLISLDLRSFKLEKVSRSLNAYNDLSKIFYDLLFEVFFNTKDHFSLYENVRSMASDIQKLETLAAELLQKQKTDNPVAVLRPDGELNLHESAEDALQAVEAEGKPVFGREPAYKNQEGTSAKSTGRVERRSIDEIFKRASARKK